MLKTENSTSVIYEFDAYLHMLENVAKYKVYDILVTEDDLITKESQDNKINWINVEKIDILDIEEIGNKTVAESKNRICGSFEAKPVYWAYAKIIVSNNTNTKRCNAITKMPRSPVKPVVFDVKKLTD
ncbi:MAG: hypothetical protein ACE5GU_08560 [Candidatus Scalinduaceae bacterium]